MENNYWDYDKLVEASEEELEEHLKYEIYMFRETYRQLNLCSRTLFERNLLLESLPAHTRVLIDFFYGERKYNNDLIAQDFLPTTVDWKNERPLQTQLLKDAKNKADKQLAHLSRWRIKIARDNKKDWDWQGISRDIEEIIKIFDNFRK